MNGTGAGHDRQLADIEAFYANQLNVITIRMGDIFSLLPDKSISQAALQIVEESQGSSDKAWLKAQDESNVDTIFKSVFSGLSKGGARNTLAETTFQRTLVSMPEPERAALRLADVLLCIGQMNQAQHHRVRVPIIWNRGDTLIQIGGKYGRSLRGQDAATQVLKSLISASFGENAAGREQLQATLRQTLDSSLLPARHREVLERYLFGGARWMTPAEAAKAANVGTKSDTALRLGKVAGTATDLLYDMRESLITIAPPGAGKSQAHVLRNLLYLKAPAVVLDIKGEMREGSAAWRAEHVGPVFVFDPKRPDQSLKYNPLDLISDDPELAWDQARTLADLLVIPAELSRSDSYFETRARDMITTAILDVALTEKGPLRSMTGVLDRIYLSEGEKLLEWFESLEELDVSQLRRAASALKGMPEKQREGILDSARRQLEIWQSSAIEKLSAETTFSADTLRETSGTLYLCVTLDDVKKFASVLRVIIGQTVATLCKVAPESTVAPVTVFLDELPKLGRMDVIENALDAGRGYSVRLWLFCQNIGQLTTVYPNGNGMIANCAARCFMNPDEEAAQRISRNLGEREGLLDGLRKPLAEPPQLTGPEFAKQMIVFLRGQPPARLDKQPAFADTVCKARMSGEEPTSKPAPSKSPATPQPTVDVRPATVAQESNAPSPIIISDSATSTEAALPNAGERLEASQQSARSVEPEFDFKTSEASTADAPLPSAGERPEANQQTATAAQPETKPKPLPAWSVADLAALPLPPPQFEWRRWAAPFGLALLAVVGAGLVYAKHADMTGREQLAAQALESAEKQIANAKRDQRAAADQTATAKAATDAAARSQRELASGRSDLDRDLRALDAERRTLQGERQAFEEQKLGIESQARQTQTTLDTDHRTLQAEQKALEERKAGFESQARQTQNSIDAQRRALELQRTSVAPPPVVAAPAPTPAPTPAPVPPTPTPTPTPNPSRMQLATAGPPQIAAPTIPPEVADCDRRASNGMDPLRSREFPGVLYGELRANTQAAVVACLLAKAAAPGIPRVRYQLARSYQAMGAEKDARPILVELTRERYPAAFDNLAELYKRDQSWGMATDLLRQGADLGDPDAKFHLFQLIEERHAAPRYQGEALSLLSEAANLGHVQAKTEAGQRAAAGALLDTAIGVFRNLPRRQ